MRMKVIIGAVLIALVMAVGAAYKFYNHNDNVSNGELAVVSGKIIIVDEIIFPRLSIKGAESPIDAGDLLVLNAIVEDYAPKYATSIKYSWLLPENRRFIGDGTSSVLCGTGKKSDEFKVGLNVTIVYTVSKKSINKNLSTSVTVIVNGDDQPDPPQPQPLPPDNSLTGLSKSVYEWSSTVNLPKEQVVKSAKLMAGNFRQFAALTINYKDPKQFLSDTKSKNNQSLNNVDIDPNAWNTWSDNLSNVLYSMYHDDRKLHAMTEYKDVWLQISVGLDAVK